MGFFKTKLAKKKNREPDKKSVCKQTCPTEKIKGETLRKKEEKKWGGDAGERKKKEKGEEKVEGGTWVMGKKGEKKKEKRKRGEVYVGGGEKRKGKKKKEKKEKRGICYGCIEGG